MAARDTADVAVVGGGVIGCISAWRLRQAGHDVVLLERGEPGGETSWAAAGILGPQSEAQEPGPMLALCLASRRLHVALAEELREATGIDISHRSCGGLELAFTESETERLREAQRWQSRAALRAELLEGSELRRRGAPETAALGLWLPDEGQVDNRKLAVALRDAATRAGVRMRSRAEVRSLCIEGERSWSVDLESGSVSAKSVVLAAGSWSASIKGVPLPEGAVRPVRGQMIALDVAPRFEPILFGKGGYAVPRAGGPLLIGATVEEAGFDKATTEEGLAYLRAVQRALVPQLAGAAILEHWAGLRPGTPDGLPLLGEAPGFRGLVIATGHYRNGILLAPITGEIVRDLVMSRAPPLDLRPFAPDRPSLSRRAREPASR